MSDLEIKEEVKKILFKLGIRNQHIKAYPYLVKFCFISVKNPYANVQISPLLTKKFGEKESKQIYRSMRFLVSKHEKEIRKYFGLENYDSISPKKLIDLISIEVLKGSNLWMK